jgi:hypothetical protein
MLRLRNIIKIEILKVWGCNEKIWFVRKNDMNDLCDGKFEVIEDCGRLHISDRITKIVGWYQSYEEALEVAKELAENGVIDRVMTAILANDHSAFERY